MPGKEKKVWLEVALNGALGKALQPNIPVSIKDIIAQGIDCASAGAAIVHLHAYDEKGAPCEDADIYSKIIEGIRSRCDAIVYPTLALHGSVEERLAPLRTLADRGLLEWSVVDPGSVNITHRMQLESGAPGVVYANPDEIIQAGLALCEEFGARPAYAIYEPGFARLGAALAARYASLPTPIYRVMFSNHFLFGTEPVEYALAFYQQHLRAVSADAPRMISGLDADIAPILPQAIEMGFHVRTGLEDATLGCPKQNVELVDHIANQVEKLGRSCATAAEVRAA